MTIDCDEMQVPQAKKSFNLLKKTEHPKITKLKDELKRGIAEKSPNRPHRGILYITGHGGETGEIVIDFKNAALIKTSRKSRNLSLKLEENGGTKTINRNSGSAVLRQAVW